MNEGRRGVRKRARPGPRVGVEKGQTQHVVAAVTYFLLQKLLDASGHLQRGIRENRSRFGNRPGEDKRRRRLVDVGELRDGSSRGGHDVHRGEQNGRVVVDGTRIDARRGGGERDAIGGDARGDEPARVAVVNHLRRHGREPTDRGVHLVQASLRFVRAGDGSVVAALSPLSGLLTALSCIFCRTNVRPSALVQRPKLRRQHPRLPPPRPRHLLGVFPGASANLFHDRRRDRAQRRRRFNPVARAHHPAHSLPRPQLQQPPVPKHVIRSVAYPFPQRRRRRVRHPNVLARAHEVTHRVGFRCSTW